MKFSLVLALLAAALLAPAADIVAAPAAKPAASYKIVAPSPLGGDGGWDYVAFEPKPHRLFISRSTHVMVVDPDSGKVVGDIPGTNGVHGFAFAPEVGK